jgi:hypothetical protein
LSQIKEKSQIGRLELEEKDYGAVVTAGDLAADHVVGEAFLEPLRQHKVIESPADVGGARVAHVTPEGVGVLGRGVEVAEGVEVAIGQEVGKALALLFGKAGRLGVGLRVLEVDLGVSHVQVAAPDHRLLLVELGQLLAERLLPLQAVGESDQAAARVRDV